MRFPLEKYSYYVEPAKSGKGTKIIAKSTNLSKTSIFMIHANKIAQRGFSAGEIKIPSYLRDNFDKFWNWPTKYTLQSGEIASKVYTCTFKIIDVLNSRDEIIDEKVSLIQREGETSFSIISDVLKI